MTPLVKIAHDLPDDYERRAILTYAISTITDSGIIDPYLTEITDSFKTVKESLDRVLNRESRSPFTKDIHQSHKSRLKQVRNIERGLNYYLNHHDVGKAKAAETISRMYDHCFKNLQDRKHATYTQVIDTFLTEAKSSEGITAFDELEMTEILDYLAIFQAKFLSSKKKRAQEETEGEHPLTVEVREEMHNMYDTLERHLYFKQHKGAAGYETLTKKINGSVTEILAVARARHTHENSERTVEDTIPETETPEETEDNSQNEGNNEE